MHRLFFALILGACLSLLGSGAVGRTAESEKKTVKQPKVNFEALREKLKQAKTPEERRTIRAEFRAAHPGGGEGETAAPPATPEKETAPAPAPEAADEYTKLAASFGVQEEEEKDIFYYRCKHIRGTTLKRILENFVTASGTVADVGETDMVVVSDIKANLEKLKLVAAAVDQRVPQVLVEAQIVELTLDSDFEREVNLAFEHLPLDSIGFVRKLLVNITTPGANVTAGEGANLTFKPYVRNYSHGKQNTLTTFFRYLETRGKAKILSAPSLILRRGVEGSIVTGEEVPIQEQTVVSGSISTSTKFKDVGITLRVTPIMITDQTVRLAVSTRVSAVTGFSANNPIIAIRRANTELEVKDGELITIGGLLRSEERSIKRKVPIVGSIPVLGHLFRGTRLQTVKTQLMIFLTIHILKESKPGDVTVHRPSDIPPVVREEIKGMDKRGRRPRAQIHSDMIMLLEDGRN